MSFRNWLCTYFVKGDEVDRWKEILEGFFKGSKATYAVGQLEKGEETENPHIQFFLNFKNKARITAITKVNKRVHCEKVIVNNGADKYCMKEETRVDGPIEFGVKPVQVNKKVDWEDVWKKAKEGKIEEIPASIRVIHYNKIKSIAKDHMEFKDSDHLRGIWIWGAAGAGKSRWAREQSKSIYPKLCNKWWDGYQGEEVIVMDDLMPDHKFLSQQLKIWSDRYDCILETKGGAVHAQYKWFIVTSQYSIDDIFEDDRDREAIHRRFQEYEITDVLAKKMTLDDMSRCPVACYNTQTHAGTEI